MSPTIAFIVTFCLLVCSIDAQSLSENPDLERFLAQELQDVIRHNKRDFRFHAARGKKSDPDFYLRYIFTH
ncbi:unnamed protein product [Cylicocyclus nassatus]|uniref:Uncharacterized protein n=1 Tax=Cylicocyclus nassatus TaxID=53992 RepID=A0AA36HG64_CYLNA|nr:unnamed protein product [Cylicocyclus nassatus]